METVITRDTDILREYIAALDARERGLSPFARLAATVKLAQLRREIKSAQLEASDADIASLDREIQERLTRTASRRIESRRWGARLSIILMLVLGPQLALAIVWLVTKLFVSFAPAPALWNPVLPHEQPAFLFVFIFFFFFVTPMLALLVLFGGRYFHSWRKTVPATLAILALSVLATFLVVRNKESNNPVRHRTSLEEIAAKNSTSTVSYRKWVDEHWLLKDQKFQYDYERYLRKGPGRLITSRFNSDNDASWRDSLKVMNEYIESEQGDAGFDDWLKDYLARNRIYPENRIDEEAAKITNSADRHFLALWQIEPYLKERDQRLYRAYLGSINRSMKNWGMLFLAIYALLFLIFYLTGPMLSFWERMAGSSRGKIQPQYAEGQAAPVRTPSRVARWRAAYYSFPERKEITTPSFFDTPLRILGRVHRSFVRLVVFTSIFVFALWALIYALDLAAGHENASSQVALMRSQLLFGGSPDRAESDGGALLESSSARQSATYVTAIKPLSDSNEVDISDSAGAPRDEKLLAARVFGLEEQVDESDYLATKRFKQQYQTIEAQNSEIGILKNLTGQLQQLTSGLPEQITGVSEQSKEQSGRAIGEASAAKIKAENIEKSLQAKLRDLESRASNAAEQAGKAEEQAKAFQARSEEFREELSRAVEELNKRTLELGERTAPLTERGLKEREAQIERLESLQRIAFAAILSDLNANVDSLERRINSSFYRMFNKGEAARDVDNLRQRIAGLKNELSGLNTDQSRQMISQLDELSKRLEQAAARIK